MLNLPEHFIAGTHGHGGGVIQVSLLRGFMPPCPQAVRVVEPTSALWFETCVKQSQRLTFYWLTGTMTHIWVPLKPKCICHLRTIDLPSFSLPGSHRLKIGRKLPFNMSFTGRQRRRCWDCFVWQKAERLFSLPLTESQQQRMQSIYVCVRVRGMVEHESALWWQIISCLFYCDHLSVRVCLCACVCTHLAHCVSVSVLPLSFLSAAYRLTMATIGALLAAAGLMSVVTAHCQPIIMNLITTKRDGFKNDPSGDLSLFTHVWVIRLRWQKKTVCMWLK